MKIREYNVVACVLFERASVLTGSMTVACVNKKNDHRFSLLMFVKANQLSWGTFLATF